MAKNHKYVNFTDRVASIRIDPIRRTDKKRNAPDAINSESLFSSSLERWNELNLATKFTEFSAQVSPLVQSLPMVLYNQSKIFDALECALRETDIYSAEAFCDLVVNFTRDLSEDFEPFYPRALKAYIDVIERFQKDDESLEVVEHAFNGLAHIFKYLARLLTTNLSPTYDLMLPLFGGTKGFKPRTFVLRFAAESMAFLVRRASGDSLDSIVSHIIKKVAQEQDNERLFESTATLLATTLKGPGTTLHSKTPVLIARYFDFCHELKVVHLMNHIIVDGLHHARKDTAQPIFAEVLRKCGNYRDEFSAQTLVTLAGLRKGDRVADWRPMFDILILLAENSHALHSWSDAASAMLCYSDMRSSTVYVKKVLAAALNERNVFRIMLSVHKMNPDVFRAFSTLFWAEVYTRASTNDQVTLKLLAALRIDIKDPPTTGKISEGVNYRDNTDLIDELNSSTTSHALFNIWWKSVIGFNISDSESEDLIRIILDLDFSNDKSLGTFRSNVVAELLKHQLVSEEILLKSCTLLLTPALMKKISASFNPKTHNSGLLLEALSPRVYDSLASCDMRVRGAALELLKSLVKPGDDPNFLLDQCSVINDLPLDLANSRNISHRLRSLITKYRHTGTNSDGSSIVSKATVFFFFGMLTVRLQPVNAAVLECIPSLAEKYPELVCNIALSFIEHPEPHIGGDFFISWSEETMDSEQQVPGTLIKVNCHNLATFEEVKRDIWNDSINIDMALQKRASESLKFDHYDDVRLLGITALSQIAKIAEKKVVPRLVPYLLEAKEDDEDEDVMESFTFKERIALLEFFAKLTKPEKLPRFDEVKNQYMYFLRSRHSPLQRLGLKCLLTINRGEFNTLRKYRENFDALLDDKRFRDELTGFISTGKDEADEGSLHPDDRKIVIPFIMRILYGRAQNSTKRNMRHAVLSSLHFLEPNHLEMFINMAHDHLMESNILGAADVSLGERDISRRVQGYLTLMTDFVRQLRTSAENTVPLIVRNGIFQILNKPGLSESKTLRHMLSKSLDEMISSTPKADIWSPLFPEITKKLIDPQLDNFGPKNLENTSSLMKMILTISTEAELLTLLSENVISAMVSTLSFQSVKDSVINTTLQIVINLTSHAPRGDVTRIAISKAIQWLPMQLDNDLSPEGFGLAIELVIKVFELKLSELDSETIRNLADTSMKALSKPSKIVPLPVKARVLLALSQIFENPSCSLELLKSAYVSLAPLFRQFVIRDARLNLSRCYKVFGLRIPEYARVGRLIEELNSFDSERLGEPDFSRRTTVFEEINEKLWKSLSSSEWRPLMFNNLFFMRDPDELALRSNGKFSIMRLIESGQAPELISEYVLPAIKRGLRDSEDKYRRLYIDLLAQCAHSDVLPSLSVLLYRGDEEADFFININHVQVHRRRRAVQRLAKHAHELDGSTIAHYLLSIVEALALNSGSKNPDLNNLADDSHYAITELLRHVSPGQFKSVARRWVQELVQEPEPVKLRKNIRVVISVAQATPSGLDDFVLNVLVAPLHRVLSSKSNEHENLPDRVPIAVAIVYFLKSLQVETLEGALPGKLTSLCHMLRSKVPELRDSVRQSLSRIMRILGAKYLKFVISELTGALRRGGMQSHVLGYTVHAVLAELNRPHDIAFEVGDTDDSSGMIFKVIMDDTFGSIGEEKDSEGYVTAAKEVKQHKSYDTAEILATWTSLSQFGQIIKPMRQFLSSTKLNSKIEHKVEEVLKRLAAGLHKNAQAMTQDAVVMGYEIFTLSEKLVNQRKEVVEKKEKAENVSGSLAARIQAARESEEFFTVRLSSRDWYEHDHNHSKNYWAKEANATKYAATNMHLLQTFALDTLRSVMTSTAGGAAGGTGKGLLTLANAKGLIPIIVDGFNSTHEDLNLATLRLATTVLRLPVSFADNDDTLEITADKALHFVESSLDTNSLLCQTALKYLTMLLRSKPEFELKGSAIAYVLERIRPDLEEPDRQSTAISFVRTMFTRKIMLPQVYDIADTISKVLVTNQSDHIRMNCRSAYVQFMTTYPLGQTRLNRHLTSLSANLRYAAASGRLSVMEAISSLVEKINTEQLEGAFIQFYTNLVLILVSDTDPDCRRRANELIQQLIALDASTQIKEQMVDLCSNWLTSFGKNNMLVRGGLEVAILFTKDENREKIPETLYQKLNKQLQSTVLEILQCGQKASSSSIDWQLLYLALGIDVTSMIEEVEGILLFPHPWVRARATRVFGNYFKKTDKSQINPSMLLRVGQKLVRQLGAPRLQSADSLQIVKDLVFIIPIWESSDAILESKSNTDEVGQPRSALVWLVHKLGSMIRTDISSEDHVGGKTGAIQVLASLPSLVSIDTVKELAYEVILSLYVLNDQLTSEGVQEDLQSVAQEALGLYGATLGTTEYYKRYTEAKQYVDSRRRERRAKRSIEAVATPELAAKKRMKRNTHKRDVRKQKKVRKV